MRKCLDEIVNVNLQSLQNDRRRLFYHQQIINGEDFAKPTPKLLLDYVYIDKRQEGYKSATTNFIRRRYKYLSIESGLPRGVL